MRAIFLALLPLLWAGCATESESSRTCAKHGLHLEKQLVVVRSGVGTFEYFKAREAGFPNAGTVYSGEISPSMQQSQMSQAAICPECMKEEAKWFKEHRLFRR